MELFVKACEKFLENEIEIYTVSEFHDLMGTPGDGKHTHNGLDSLAIANGNFSSLTLPSQRIPRERKENWSDIQSNKGITIHQYLEPDVPALSTTILRPITSQVTEFKYHYFYQFIVPPIHQSS